MARVSWFASALALLLVSGAAHADDSAPDPVTGALVDGEVALAHHDAAALMRAARTLAEHRAHPEAAADGTPDLARAWAHQAVLWGARPVAVTRWRGRLSGPGYRLLTLPPGGRFQTRQVFTAGQAARVEVAALGPGPFRLSIGNADARPLCQREASGGRLTCTWTPTFSEPHDIAIDNPRKEAGRYYLVTF